MQGEELKGNGVQGLLCLRNPTPGMCRRLLNTTKSLKGDYFGYFPRNPSTYMYMYIKHIYSNGGIITYVMATIRYYLLYYISQGQNSKLN